MQNNYVVIMAGGVGSRFWPSSRAFRPKQFLDILGTGKSLLQSTVERFLLVCPLQNIYIVTNSSYRVLVQEQLPGLPPNQILCEPSRNNTAPSVAYTAFKLHQINPNANFVVAPSDHLILKEEEFIRKINKGFDFVSQNDALLTLGIQPTRPDTGYGYIHFDKQDQQGFHKVHKFTEKPNLQTAQTFLDTGEYLWNAGIFLWNVQRILEAFKIHSPKLYSIFDQGRDLFGTAEEQAFIDQYYPTTPKISIDYAIMEKAENIYTLPADIGWSDLGTWASLHSEAPKDSAKNAVNGTNEELVIRVDTSDCMIRSQSGKLVVIKGLENYIVVDEKDVLLIYPKDKEQEIKGLTKDVVARLGDHFA